MTELVDAKLVGELARIFDFPPERIIWGQLFTAKLYWTKFFTANKGVAELPYMSFYRLPKFHDQTKKSEKIDFMDYDGTAKTANFIPIMLSYTVELMQPRVIDQSRAFKKYMLWAGTESAISFKDEVNVDWAFRIIPEDPEDNSDLEAEEDQGRVIRTTFNFQVESILIDKDDTAMPILEILTRIHGYYDDISKADLIFETKIP